MKKVLLIISLFCMHLFGGSIYFGIDLSQELDYGYSHGSVSESDFEYFYGHSSDDGNRKMDQGSLIVGYNHSLFQNGNFALAFGVSIMARPILEPHFGEDLELDIKSVYFMPTYSFDENFMGWFSLGFGNPGIDFNHYDGGLSYGFGGHYKMTDKLGIGIGRIVDNIYNKNEFTDEDDKNAIWFEKEDITLKRLTFFLTYSL